MLFKLLLDMITILIGIIFFSFIAYSYNRQNKTNLFFKCLLIKDKNTKFVKSTCSHCQLKACFLNTKHQLLYNKIRKIPTFTFMLVKILSDKYIYRQI